MNKSERIKTDLSEIFLQYYEIYLPANEGLRQFATAEFLSLGIIYCPDQAEALLLLADINKNFKET